MPFSILIQGYPRHDAPVPHVQGPAVQGMFLHLLREVEPAVCERLHDDSQYRPYTLSPLGLGEPSADFQGFRLPRQADIRAGTPCYVRVTLLEDSLFPTFSTYFLSENTSTFRLGSTQFTVTAVHCTTEQSMPWSTYESYVTLIESASPRSRKISLHFLTPTSFRRGDVDFPLPDPRLVFRSYRKRFEEFYQIAFLPDFDEQVEFYTGIHRIDGLRTNLIKTKRVQLGGFTGEVTYIIDKKAPPDLAFQMNLLADYALFCGTGRKTTMGMGQTVRRA